MVDVILAASDSRVPGITELIKDLGSAAAAVFVVYMFLKAHSHLMTKFETAMITMQKMHIEAVGQIAGEVTKTLEAQTAAIKEIKVWMEHKNG